MQNPPTVCGHSFEDVLNTIRRFHGWPAPGVVIGGFMVDLARERLGAAVEADAIVETIHCLPDAVQLFTPCTYGNGWMKVLDWDKFALTLYDKRSLQGVRVWVDTEKLRRFPDIYNWYMRLVPKRDLPLETLLTRIEEAGRHMLSWTPVTVCRYHEKHKKGKTELCSSCGEAYPADQGEICLACQGKGYYRRQS